MKGARRAVAEWIRKKCCAGRQTPRSFTGNAFQPQRGGYRAREIALGQGCASETAARSLPRRP
jgi:hypothetical protein